MLKVLVDADNSNFNVELRGSIIKLGSDLAVTIKMIRDALAGEDGNGDNLGFFDAFLKEKLLELVFMTDEEAEAEAAVKAEAEAAAAEQDSSEDEMIEIDASEGAGEEESAEEEDDLGDEW